MQPKREEPQPLASDLAWRAEIRERVRALRAKRELEAELAIAIAREKAPEKNRPKQLRLPIEAAMQQKPVPGKLQHPAIAAALKRLERAHPAPSKPEGATAAARANAQVSAVAVGRGAAAALAPVAEAPREEPPPVQITAEMRSTPAAVPVLHAAVQAVSTGLGVIEQFEADSKLEELIEFDPAIFNDAAPLRLRLLGGIVDAIAVTVTSIPFLALAELADANYRDPLTRTMIGAMLAGVLVGYFAIAVGITGKTVGMHFAGIRVVDYLSRLQPNFVQTTLRAFGYLFSGAPLMAGLIWILIDDEHRGWHDHISSTAVVQDQ